MPKTKRKHVTAVVMISPRMPREVKGTRSAEVTVRAPTHELAVKRAIMQASGWTEWPYECKLVGKVRRLPSRKYAGADMHVMCDVADVYTVASRQRPLHFRKPKAVSGLRRKSRKAKRGSR